MSWAQTCLRHFAAVMWLYMVSYVRLCQCYSIDQIIARAMKSPRGYGFMYDEIHKTVRVDMDMVFSVDDWAKITALGVSRAGKHVTIKNNSGGIHMLQKRQAIMEGVGARYWPQGIIYYEIDRRQFSKRDIRILQAAMEEWMRYTCVQFKPAHSTTRNKIKFVDGNGCASSVGMARYPQTVTLSKGCRVKGVVIHELGHVLGFNHEQTRPDRDNYVKIIRKNIPDHLEYNFYKHSWAYIRNLGVPYDYLSIMHYGKDAFSANGGVTIETRDRRFQELIGNRRALSFRDIKSANILYNCRPARSSCRLRDEDCPGEGFVSKDCTCWCPTQNHLRYPGTRPYYDCTPGNRQTGGDGINSSADHDSSRPKHANLGSTESAGSNRNRGSGNRGSGNRGSGSSDCEDQNVNCDMWASRGECHKNRLYMQDYCRKACGLCDTVAPSCQDDYSRCAFWKEQGFCGTSTPFSIFITNNCKRTCGFCKTAPGPEGSKTLPCERTCTNENEQCQTWAARGECTATPDYMQRYCKKACNSCCSADARLVI